MNVPEALFSPVVLSDRCVGDPYNCQFPDSLVRIDGGPVVVDSESLLDNRVTTLRAFVVHGTAPDRIADLNGDGIINIADAEASGLTLLSSETVFRFKEADQNANTFFRFLRYDLDGNGMVGDALAPPAPGEIVYPPR